MTKGQEAFLKSVTDALKAIGLAQESVLEEVAQGIFGSLSAGGVWHLFGAGHSHMAVEEAFHRAGGLIPVNPWLEEYLMPHAGPRRNGPMERLSGLAPIIFDFYKPLKGEWLTVFSNSGINATSVEMAMLAKERGIKTVAVTSLQHAKSSKSRHPSQKKLFEVADLVIDTGGVAGDAVVSIEGLDVKVAPMSSILSGYIVNLLSIRVCELFAAKGTKAPVYLSANLPGGDERNQKLEEKYLSRIPRLQ